MLDRKLCILSVDDEASVSQSIRFALSSSSRQLASALDGEEALEKINQGAPEFDVVITDNSMPRVSGLELVRRLRLQNFAGRIIVLSAFLSDELRAAYADLHVDKLMPKPFDLSELRREIDAVAAAA